ncbi:glycoside hydrolase family 108 protein [Pseudovibrio sp. Ad37]|uniref:glycoside hydrolase family 108 protein n=1 Tax=Pseudovibrio sp. Ad37 TaxID=989422 RepID=UPI0007AE9609|nr:glycosyl hydrolase 108 family protein [Pseudovibrio sp. Ad37]KZL18167.1 putative Peptidoglycan domain protein [Pseudovibrio sp. Ad37]
MAKQNFGLVMKWVGLSEMGYVDHPKDPGGATNHGVTIKTLSKWRGCNVSKDEVKALTKVEAEEILKTWFFDPVRFDELPAGLDYTVVDFSINSGAKRAIEYLQRALGVDDDGVFGRGTMDAVKRAANEGDMPDLIKRLNEKRWAYMKRLSNWSSFKNGWTRRVMGDEIGIQDGDIGVIDRSTRLHEQAVGVSAKLPIPVPKPAAGKAEGKASLKSNWMQPEGLSKIATGVSMLGSAVSEQPILQVGLVAMALLGFGFLLWQQMNKEPA